MLDRLNNIPKDKLLHALVGLTIFVFVSIFTLQIVALSVVYVAGVGKEIYDKFHPKTHTADIKDILATVVIPTIVVIVEYLKVML